MGEKLRKPKNTSCMRAGRKKGACVSLRSTQSTQRSVNRLQRHPLYTQTHPNKHSDGSRSLLFSLPPFLTPPLNTTRTEHILLQTTVRRVCLPLQHNTERDERERGERRRREERCSKSQEGGIYVDVGEIHHPPSLAFLLQRGSRGPHNHSLIITSMEGR